MLVTGTAAHAATPAAPAANSPSSAPLEFNRDIRPILSENCFKCHGPDKASRQANLRLDQRDAAIKGGDDGPAFVVGQSGKSALVSRITSKDKDERMPPPDTGKHLTAAQIALLKRWIDQGAEYQPHWSLIPPRRPALPAVRQQTWPRGAIDQFVLARLQREGLKPAAEADKRTLIRRVTLDLTGLPPDPSDVHAFLADTSPDAYEKVVDRLLASSEYAEHMARDWLDLARYSDTNGYQYDTERTQWPWRDWVINAFARNMPYDQFTIEQLAGDLLPNATPQQKLATGFNRNHAITIEGGVIDEEYRTEYVMDRLVTSSTVWLGLTVGCARCHDHKFDPISNQEFYQLFAFFNQVQEKGFNGFDPQLKVLSPLQQQAIEELDARIAAIKETLKQTTMTVPTVVPAKPSPAVAGLQADLKSLEARRKQLEAGAVNTFVMHDLAKPRDTFILERGQYDKHGKKVQPGVLAALPPLPAGAPANRLGLAKWLTDPKHPLMARVAVNRYWQHYFGVGLVKTAEDLGSQGEWPSHPELLDWLATEFIGSGWDVKHMQRLIVTSAAYRQSSVATAAERERDPENRLLARGPRFRLDAEEIRDSLLDLSGLLVEKVGGPSVYPYQPAGLWMELNNRPGFSRDYPQAKGEALYRRSMYTFGKRTVAAPAMQTFDAPTREYCVARRSRTNTPLQSLALMYDPQSVEAARKFAERMIRRGGPTVDDRIGFGFEAATSRLPNAGEAAVLRRVYEQQLATYQKDPAAAERLLKVGDSPRDEKLAATEAAALATVARVIMNLDETITKP
ncbi:MAG: PSD1 and planctomycete cytochrome C domain-containing protein [Planctomycetia bacterium]|nr:PSD1 and planctomycete cytochrome C domain-containing protein [Planctomycetia bacterium]